MACSLPSSSAYASVETAGKDVSILKLIYRDQEWEVRPGMTVRDAILKVGLDPESVLAVRDGQLINEETIVREDDEIKLISVISGGAQ